MKIEKRGAADQAGRWVLQRVKAVYRWAVIHERIANEPMLDLVLSEILSPRGYTAPRWPTRSCPEFRASWTPTKATPTPRARCALILTATRPGECARGAEFDRDAALWVIPPERMKMRAEHCVPCRARVVEMLRSMQALSGGRDRWCPSPAHPSKPRSETLHSAPGPHG